VPMRLRLLLGALALVVVVFAVTLPMQQKLRSRAEVLRREVEESEKDAREELATRAKRQERVKLLEGLAAAPEDFDLLMKTGSFYVQDREYEDAVFLFQEARRIRPEAVEPYRALYQTYIADARYDRSYDAATEGRKRHPDDVELILGLVHLNTLMAWNREARELINHLKQTTEADNPRVLIASAMIYRQLADTRHAEEDLKAAAAKDPQNGKIHALLSKVQMETGRESLAMETIRRALELEPENGQYLLHLAELQRGLRTPESLQAAKKTAEKALSIELGSSDAYFAIIQTQLAQKHTEEAQRMLESLRRRHPDHPGAALELGKLYVRQGRAVEGQKLLDDYSRGVAIADRSKGLSVRMAMQPKNPEAYVEMAEMLVDNGAPEKAIVIARRALQLVPGSRPALLQLSRALESADRAGEFLELARRPEWHLPEFMETPGTGR